MKAKRRIPAILILSLFLAVIGYAAAGLGESAAEEITVDYFPVYLGSTDAYLDEPFPLYFVNGVTDLPYVELESWCDFINILFQEVNMDSGYQLTCTISQNTVQYVRENGYTMSIDYDSGTITFDDYNGFIHSSNTNASLIDILDTGRTDLQNNQTQFKRLPEMYFDRYGDAVTLNLFEYDIPMPKDGEHFYLPLQTLGDFMISVPVLQNTLFNGKAVFIVTGDQLMGEDGGLTPLGEMYYSVPAGDRSVELANYGYGELCLALDKLYGLKEAHGITSFAQLFDQIGFEDQLKSLNPEEADVALYNFIDFYLDDLHSEFSGYSCFSGFRENDGSFGAASRKLDAAYDEYKSARTDAYPDGIVGYEEVGNTAYITFDSFDFEDIDDIYTYCDDEFEIIDTFTQIIHAHRMIFREESPVENVVLDLSNNLGGAIDAAVFVMGWFLGEVPLSWQDVFTGAQSIALYRADVNLDHEFDELDTLDGKNLYCLISPVSFSCGNLVPALFKSTQKVTLIGRTSGGGTCVVLPMTTAWGTIFQISSPYQLSFTKNGSYYDVDKGVEPDVYINHIPNYYNRDALTEFINNLF